MNRLTSSLLLALVLAAGATLVVINRTWAQNGANQPSFAQTAYHGEGSITFVDPDRSRVGFTDEHGNTYTIDSYDAEITVPALSTSHATTGDLVKHMRIAVDGYMLSPSIIEADRIKVLPYVAPNGPIEAPSEEAPAPAPPVEPAPIEPAPPVAKAHIDLQGTVVSYHAMEETNLDYDLYTVHINDHDRNIRIYGPDVVREENGDSIDAPLNPGDRVHVTGTLLPSGDVRADHVTRIGAGDFFPGQKHFEGGNILHGVVTDQASVFSRDLTIRVRETDVSVKVPGGIPVRENGHPISVHDLGSHERVTVYGRWVDAGTFQADRIDAATDDD